MIDRAKITQVDRRRFKHHCTLPEQEEGHWVWNGAINTNGEPIFSAQGTTIAAHRFAFLAWVGDIPEKIIVVRTCTFIVCVNPAHLAQVDRRAKPFCKRGHQFTELNTRYNKNGSRVCRQCERDRQAEKRTFVLSLLAS